MEDEWPTTCGSTGGDRQAATDSMLTPALRWSMVLPALVPMAIVLLVYGAEEAGHKWNVHGDLIGMVFLFLVSLVVGGVVEILALIKVLPALAGNPKERTLPNVLCTGMGVAFVLFLIGVILWWFIR